MEVEKEGKGDNIVEGEMKGKGDDVMEEKDGDGGRYSKGGQGWKGG